MRPSTRAKLSTAIIAIGLLSFTPFRISAQAAEIPDAVIVRALQTPGADVSALQLVETNSPFQYGYGTYWSVQKDPWPPLPFNWLFDQDGVSVYSAGPGVFLVDDSSYDYDSELLAQAAFTAMDWMAAEVTEGRLYIPPTICGWNWSARRFLVRLT